MFDYGMRRHLGVRSRKVVVVMAAAALLAGGLLVGCGEDQETATTSASTAVTVPATTAQTAAGETFVLKSTRQSAEGSWPSVHAEIPWAEAVIEATGGAVQWEDYYSNSLAKTADFWGAVESGIADQAYIPQTAYPGLTPLSDVITLPFLQFEGSAQASGIFWKLYEEFPNIRAEWEPHKVNYFVIGTCNFILGNKLYKVLDDFKGSKVRPTGGTLAPAQLGLLGANAVTIPGSDVYLSLEQGVLDAAVAQWDFTIGFRLYETAQYITYAPVSAFIISNIMNIDVWNSMPPEVQAGIDSVSGVKRAEMSGNAQFDVLHDEALKQMKEAGVEVTEYTVPDDELEKWIEVAGKPLWDQWVADMNKAGYPEAQEILDRTFELIETYHPVLEE